MENITRAYYEAHFENLFLKSKGAEFQNFFSKIMETRYPSDFVPIRPWGNLGDRKNDGYLVSQKSVHQVYAPNEMELSKAKNKIDMDLEGALTYWNGKMKKWIFVHNSFEGLSADITSYLEEKKQEYSSIEIGIMGRSELRDIVFSMNEQDIAYILGPAPSDKAMRSIQLEDLKIVILSIGAENPVLDEDIKSPPIDKIVYNKLSEEVKTLIIAGMRKSPLVKIFFTKWHDRTFADKITQAFKNRYSELKRANLPPDEIYMQLIEFAGGKEMKSPTHLSAVLAIVSHFFEECDIFEGYDEGDLP
ncbi:ABC-three component system protein [Methanoregula sp. UBA64]|jgi:hypothetical protein|uniref:ABC-three component system protein n=1 Tax=Methanoregula sp. UBA64 TaxID=1915554 RepID=UPI0025D126BF|nr:ABC-three component system protein [Methanoregula sp. UBA64]